MRPAITHSSIRITPRPAARALDPCTLGRPIHLLCGFTAALRADLGEFFRSELNRRYGASFEVGAVSFDRVGVADASTPRWLFHASEVGRVGFALGRELLLGVMRYRYGEPTGTTQADVARPLRETATEERLYANLGLRLVRVLAARIDATAQAARDDEAPTPIGFVRAGPMREPAGTWTVRAEVHEPLLEISGVLWFTLDEAWMARLLRKLAPARDKPIESARRALPLSARLQLTLTGQLIRKELMLGELIDLRVGDVIPIRLGATEVLIDDSRLFTAAVVEHKGKLCLTSFETVE